MQTEASFIIRNARVLTMDAANPRANAVAIAGNRILAVGPEAEIDAFSGPDTHVIDAGGGTVLPGFNEAHMHIFGGSAELSELSLAGVKGFDALEKAVKAYAAEHPERRLLIAQQADYTILSDDERMTRHHLDRILPDRALLIVAPDHHTAWANTTALTMGGILEGRDVGVGNEIVMGEDGLASGELRESNAIRPISAFGETGGREMLGVGTGGDPEHVTAEERAGDIEVIKRGLAYVASLGITSLQNMDGSLYQLEMLDEIERTVGLPVRVRMPFHMKNFMPLSDLETKAAAWRERFNTDRLRCDFVKLFMDGVTESGTAVFIDDYTHQPGWKGEPLFSQDHFDSIAIAADRLGLPVAVHAIGDGAVRMVLNGYEAAIKANGKRDSRNRIEHIEVVHPDDIPRFKELGTVASMQPTHPPGSADLPVEPYLSYIGEDRWPHAFAWRTLVDAGAEIVFATDWPVSPLDPMHCIECAMTRGLWKEGLKDQRLSLAETLAAYTKNGAWVEFMEDRKGMLKPGYLADIVVLSGNVEAADHANLAAIRPVTTMCDGRITYQA
ncbi:MULTISPECIES: amidohydrolase [unclassified Shinella]|uniref:amidohydrolase n=1 Tax=unclassified Shinella TaxID=2643062 RepID=UPI00225CF3AC|nr:MULTISPECIES: amidohydrolase [unclassified Shinella]MCO5138176.1 amidohydrolase [Shinella sp.]MDC7258293.1 amidohydrolase [Shinella sp. YE25]CAI0335694.1 Amidohydro_3 domain-containing protein [Rhizobiaceae bacterium]CAK7259996.1 Amidohydrolase 3 domain-containing protein [Shinella sp. WSC3-e]